MDVAGPVRVPVSGGTGKEAGVGQAGAGHGVVGDGPHGVAGDDGPDALGLDRELPQAADIGQGMAGEVVRGEEHAAVLVVERQAPGVGLKEEEPELGRHAAEIVGACVEQAAVIVAHVDAESALAEVEFGGLGRLEARELEDAFVHGGEGHEGFGP